MFRTDYSQETLPFIIEGEYTQVLGAGEVVSKIAVAHTPIEIITNLLFDEEGVIPVLLDEFAVSDEDQGYFYEISRKLSSGMWPGFVTFGSSELIRSRRLQSKDPSHFMILLRGLAEEEGFIAVVDNDERNSVATNSPMLRSEIGVYQGIQSVLKVRSDESASIEFVAPQSD